MKLSPSKWFAGMVALACVGCCAIPLYALVTGVFGIGLLGVGMTQNILELIVCVLPLFGLVIGYFVYKSKSVNKTCCNSPDEKCSDTQCANK
ncbi:hypothetical protein GCM10011613_04260 [Cellvibrio zantedeschiae]|uniref:Mercuric ion transport protein n=1 Tax=Cellvibrio zantedeschiae TaxID=1237077 RepID=A0ABQ3AQ31_9GAMM|nr:hypothetical protein [Cellvibrio zantedeschiae]GGY63698.1 hypothetical protein GCM10011613_04260 [Cellvibrio zantedeschiae]